MAGHRLQRTACPRCGRDVALSPIDQVPVRHKADGSWCSGEPKSSPEIVLDILQSINIESDLLRELTDAYLECGQTLVRISGEVAEQKETTTRLIKQAGAAVRAEIERLRP